MPVILSKYIDEKGCIVVKHENNDRYGHYFTLTKKRSETLKTKLLLSKQIQYDGETFDAKDFVYKYQAQKCRMLIFYTLLFWDNAPINQTYKLADIST